MLARKIPKVLFICTGNACRSQMAEGWVKHLKPGILEAYSAGIEKHGLDPLAVKVMAEVGVDISKQKSKLLSDLDETNFDYLITVCNIANETCPIVPANIKRVHHSFDNPPKIAATLKSQKAIIALYCRVRDEIRDFVKSMPDNL